MTLRLVFFFILNSLTEPSNARCSFQTLLHALFIQCYTCHHTLKVIDQVRLDRLLQHFIWRAGNSFGRSSQHFS